MLVKILGSAAGGGFPQWNCVCRNCDGLRAGVLRGKARTQTQIGVSSSPEAWFLVGASPDLQTQIVATPELSPSLQVPGRSPISGVFVLSADVDGAMGLLHLREFQSFSIFATRSVQRILTRENRIFGVLDRTDPPVRWQTLTSNQCIGVPNATGDTVFLCTATALGQTFPDYVSEEVRHRSPREEACVGLLFEQGGRKLFVAPTIADYSLEWINLAASADVAILDGTFWTDDELRATGRTCKTAREMGHLPLSGPDGLLARYPRNAGGRKILIHINNTNPILDEESDQHRAVLETGFEIAYDGLTFQV